MKQFHCQCGSYAINDDPDRKLCDRCWRDAKITRLLAKSDEAREMVLELSTILSAHAADVWESKELDEIVRVLLKGYE